MKYYIIAGEVSGDLHGSYLMQSIKEKDPSARFRYWGGDKMLEQDPNIVKHISKLAFMGLVEVLKNLRTILKNIAFCKRDISDFNPDVLVLIDYPGFNLKIAQYAKKKGYKVAYYIAPQVWAWKESRVKQIKKFVDRLMVILPFEKDFFMRHGVNASFVGHPLSVVVNDYNYQDDFHTANNLDPAKPIIALLPGSRSQEIQQVLPDMIKVSDAFPNFQFVIAGVHPHKFSDYPESAIPIIFNQTYDVLKNADAAIVTSGTATLETALHKIPQVVVYKGSWLLYIVAKSILKIRYISLVNLIADAPVVEELIQKDCTPHNIELALRNILQQPSGILNSYSQVVDKLGQKNAPDLAANIILDLSKS